MPRGLILFVSLIFLGSIWSLPKLIGKWREWSAPTLAPKDLAASELALTAQRELVIGWELKRCEALEPCLLSTRSHNSDQVALACQKARTDLAQISVPERLPASVNQNLAIYLASSVNTAQSLEDAWSNRGKRRSVFRRTFFPNWEIDTCGFESLPQKIFRLYSIDQMAGSKIVLCENIRTISTRPQTPQAY